MASPIPRLAVTALTVGALCAGCHRHGGARAAKAPPLGQYEVTFELPPKAGKPVPTPPAAAVAPYRVWVVQEAPLQKKTPVWRTYASEKGALLDMAPDGSWRCLVTAASISGVAGEMGKLDRWVTTRLVRCSTDGWNTYSEAPVSIAVGVDGTTQIIDPPGTLRLEDVVQGVRRHTVVALDRAGVKLAP